MRLTATILFLFILSTANATTYYVSAAGTTGNNGTTTGTTWNKTKVNSFTFSPGDQILFKKGDTFSGALTINGSGTANNPITVATYGTGAAPIIDGFTTLTSWTLSSGNIYYATIDVPKMQTVTFDGVLTGMGRYPKTGYLPIQSHVNLSSITSTSIGSLPANLAGAECVMKKARYLSDRHPVNLRSGNTLNLLQDSSFGVTSDNQITDGNGFFIQHSLSVLTQDKDWYYDSATNRLYVYFASGTSSHVVRASSVNNLIDVIAHSYINFNGLDLRGANLATVGADYADHITLTKCKMSFATDGYHGLQGSGYNKIDSCVISNTHSVGIYTYESFKPIISNTLVRDIALIPGMSRSGDLVATGIVCKGDSLIVALDSVINVAYAGIAVYESGALLVENNRIDSFCIKRDDGGGLYFWGAHTYPGRRLVRNNYVTNGIGNIEGISPNLAGLPFGIGIYVDDFANNLNIYNNVSGNNAGTGLFFHSTRSDTATGNILFNNGSEQFLMLYEEEVGQEVYDLLVTNNQFICYTTFQIAQDFEMYVPNSNLSTIGTFANNYFYRPFGLTNYIRRDNRQNGGQIVDDYTIGTWNSTYGKEGGSTNATVPASSPADFRVDFNYTAAALPLTLPAIYKDVTNTTYSGLATIPAYSGKFLVYSGSLPVVPVINVGQIIRGRKVIIGYVP